MALPITIPYTFANATTSIPLANLDSDFTVLVNAVNGIANGTNALANVNIIGGTIDNVAIGATTPANGTFTNLIATTSNVGTISIGTWNGSPIGVAYGGTNLTSYTVGDLVYASGTTTLAKLADVATGSVLVSGGVGVVPSYSANPTVTSLTSPTVKSASSLTLQTNGTTNAMTIDTSQNVGIGTSSPAASLSVVKQTTALSGTGNGYGLYMYPTSSGLSYIDAITGSTGNTSLGFRTYNNGTYNEVRIDSSGNVGIGTTSPVGRLDVVSASQDQLSVRSNNTTVGASILVSSGNGTTSNNYSYIQYQNSQTSAYNWKVGTFGSNSFSFYDATASAERMRIDTSGNLGFGTTSVGGGAVVIAIANATTVPTTNPTGGGILYVQAGALKYRGSSGTVTTIANA